MDKKKQGNYFFMGFGKVKSKECFFRRIKISVFASVLLGAAVLSGCSRKTESSFWGDSIISLSKAGGVYEEEFTLTVSFDKGYEVYYTTDGSDPDTSETAIKYEKGIKIKERVGDANVVSAVDTSLISTNFCRKNGKDIVCYIEAPSNEAVDKCTALRFVAKDSAGRVVESTGATYFIGTAKEHIEGITKSCQASQSTLAVISITMEYDDLFDSKTGIYVRGDVFEEAYQQFMAADEKYSADDTRKVAANYSMRGREWEREVHIDFFEMDSEGGKTVLSQDCGIRIQGNYSRSDLQKGLRLYARSDYGESKFNYAIFGDDLKNTDGKTIDKFDTFVLRAGGNCAFTCKYNDTYWQSLVGEMNVDTKASRPCVVYLNGEYLGLYVLEEDYSDDYYEEHYGVDKDDVIVYKGDAESLKLGYKLDEGKLPEGETDESYYFKDLLEFFDTHKNLKSKEDYEEFAKLVDVDSVMDYFAVEVWINNKWDWPGKNWSMWKTQSIDGTNPYVDGRWRFSLYDIEFGGVSGASDAGTNTIKEDNYKPKGLLDMGTDNPAVLCFAYLMTNEGFRSEYCNRLLSLSDTYLEKENALVRLDEFESVYGPLFNQFFNRYPGTGSMDNALNGGYASSACIRAFLERRQDNIQKMVDWVEKQY